MFARRWPALQLRQSCFRCTQSTVNDVPAPSQALLFRVRNDMKAAMKAKDKPRLDVLRGLIAEITNSAKNSKPVTTDSQLLSLIRKRVKISEAAAAEFQSAEREDLRNREIAQISMLHEYIQDSDSISEEAITKAVQDVISNMKTKKKDVSRGIVMKALIGPGGSLEGQMVDNSEVARIVGGMM